MANHSGDTANTAGALLERAGEMRALEEHAAAVRRERRGRLVLLAGEAGIGKTSLLRAFVANDRSVRVLAGACDALHTPRPLGPVLDVAEQAGGDLARQADRGAAPAQLVTALAGDVERGSRLTLVVLEDLHWADGATLDVLRLLARRIDTIPALVVVTYRDDELDRTHPLRVALGELPSGAAERIALAPLSPAAITALTEESEKPGVDPAELHTRTAGNPFYVTEVLAASNGALPGTVRDAVLARAARLDPAARRILDAVAVVPQRAELWLLEALAPGGDLSGLDECLASGMLRARHASVAFRHEIARVAIEESLSPHAGIALHRKALAALAAPPHGAPDPTRLSHHAEAADDRDAVLEHAPRAGDRAAALGCHRQAADQYERALRHADLLEPQERAGLLERLSYECYLTNCIADAADARRRALAEHERVRDRRREGDAHRWLSRLTWYSGDNETAEREARIAIQLLEPLSPGPELAMAYSNMAQLRMLASDLRGATRWGDAAIALAERLDETEILVHALNNVGSAEMVRGLPQGAAKLERSLALARAADLDEHVARAYTNLATIAIDARDYELVDVYLHDGLAYCAERDLDSWLTYMTGYRARAELDRGHYDAAQASVALVLDGSCSTAPTRITPLAVLGRLRARTGDGDPWAPLDEARDLASATGELQRVTAVAIARAEVSWLTGEPERIEAETTAALEAAVARDHDPWVIGELCVWRRRAGIVDDVPPGAMAEPYRFELAGQYTRAAKRWAVIGCPYESALAASHADAERTQRAALAELQRLGARTVAGRVARGLRARGVRGLKNGPRAATRENPAGMTARELEVLAHVAEGLRNAEIAARLFLSEKTVSHHVSAILRKLGVGTRSQAGAEAARLGIVER